MDANMTDILNNVINANVLVCFTGSVATVKVPEIVSSLINDHKYNVILIGSSDKAFHFLNRSKEYNSEAWNDFESVAGTNGSNLLVTEEDEWTMWNHMGDSVLHIELRKWADMLIVVPASADIIAKISAGFCDSLVLSIIRAWDANKPKMMCPAMNTLMWTNKLTEKQIRLCEMELRWAVTAPISKSLACNDVGIGALAEVKTILFNLTHILESYKKSTLEHRDPLTMYTERKVCIELLQNKLRININKLQACADAKVQEALLEEQAMLRKRKAFNASMLLAVAIVAASLIPFFTRK